MADLPAYVYQHVDDNWGSSGVAAAEYVYQLFLEELEGLRADVDEMSFAQDDAAELRERVREAALILDSI